MTPDSWGPKRVWLLLSSAVCVAVILADFVCMMIFMDSRFQSVTDQPSTLAIPAISIVLTLHAVVAGLPMSSLQYATHCLVHIASGFCCIYTAVKLGDPDPPRWSSGNVRTEALASRLPTSALHQVVIWLVGILGLLWAALCAYKTVHPDRPRVMVRPSPIQNSILLAAHSAICGLGALTIAFSLISDIVFRQVPSWRRFDSPMALAYLAIFFACATAWRDVFTLRYSLVGGALTLVAVCTATAYLLLLIRHVDDASRWNDHGAYRAMFPAGAQVSREFGSTHRYVAEEGFTDAFASAFATYGTHVHVCEAIIASCCYGLLALTLAHPILRAAQGQ